MAYDRAYRPSADAFRLRSFEVGEAEVRYPWGVRRPAGGWQHHLYLLQGAPCRFLPRSSQDAITLSGLSICMINDRRGHAFQDARASPIDHVALPSVDDTTPCFRTVRYGGTGGDATTSFYVGGSSEPGSLTDLPPLIIVNLGSPPDWLAASVPLIRHEMLNRHVDTAARLCEFLMLKTIQTFGERHDASLPCRFGAKPLDPRIARAIAMIDEAPTRAWRLQDLADAVGMSRARLTARWRDAFGLSIFDYISKLRLAAGASLLCDTTQDVGMIAYRSGFASHAAFSTAFKRAYSMTPERYRRRSHEGPLDYKG